MCHARTPRKPLVSSHRFYFGKQKSTEDNLHNIKFLCRWINPLLIKGYKFDLSIKDMFRPLKKDDATLRANILTE